MKPGRLISILILIPFYYSCQNISEVAKDAELNSENIEEVSDMIRIDLFKRSSSFFMCGNLNDTGLGLVDLNTDFFCFKYATEGFTDSLKIPEGGSTNFYNVIGNKASGYYYLDAETGIFRLTKSGPVFMDSINDNSELKRNGLMISNVINNYLRAHLTDKGNIIIPLSRDYYSKTGTYSHQTTLYPMFCEYNLQTKQVRLLNCLVPQELSRLDFAGKERDFFSCVKGDSLIVGWPHTPELVIYSISADKEIGVLQAQSNFQTEQIQEFGLTGTKKGRLLLEQYEITSPFYDNIFYNHERREYYRIFYHGLPLRNAKGEYSIYSDKQSSIMVLDENLKLKREILLKENAFILFGITSTDSGFIVNAYGKKVDGKFMNYEIKL